MITKYDIGDEVLVKAKIESVKSNIKGKIKYIVHIENDPNRVTFDEEDIIAKAGTDEIQKLRDMVNTLYEYCNHHYCGVNCVIQHMECFETTTGRYRHTGYNLSDEQLLENKDLIIQKYEAVMKEKEK